MGSISVFFRIVIVVLLTFLGSEASSLTWRKDRHKKEFSYFLYPIYGDVPGIGSTWGAGMTAANIFGTDMDTTLFYTRGGFDAGGVTLTSLHLIPNFLTVGGAYYQSRLPRSTFERGMQSQRDPLFLAEQSENAGVGYARIQMFDFRFHVYSYLFSGVQATRRVLSPNREIFTNPRDQLRPFQRWVLGSYIDLTDHWVDPRQGVYLEVARKQALNFEGHQSPFFNLEYNLQTYVPIGQRNTLALGAYSSQTILTGTADSSLVASALSLNCSALANPEQQTRCLSVEASRILDQTKANAYGRGVGLGGTQRLRSYPTGRFQGAHSVFYGAEFRWNLTDVEEHWDLGFLRQLHTGIQWAFFAETGSVNDELSQIHNGVFRSSYGSGLRVLFSGAVVRLDFAIGDEGSQLQFFFDYPWGITSIEGI